MTRSGWFIGTPCEKRQPVVDISEITYGSSVLAFSCSRSRPTVRVKVRRLCASCPVPPFRERLWESGCRAPFASRICGSCQQRAELQTGHQRSADFVSRSCRPFSQTGSLCVGSGGAAPGLASWACGFIVQIHPILLFCLRDTS